MSEPDETELTPEQEAEESRLEEMVMLWIGQHNQRYRDPDLTNAAFTDMADPARLRAAAALAQRKTGETGGSKRLSEQYVLAAQQLQALADTHAAVPPQVVQALQASEQFFAQRDLANAAVHLAPVRYSPITHLVRQALAAVDAEQNPEQA